MLYHTHIFQCSNIQINWQTKPALAEKRTVQPTGNYIDMFFLLKGHILSWPLLAWAYVRKKKKSWCSCLARLWDWVVLVMQWPKFSSEVLWYNQWVRGQLQVMFLVSSCVYFFSLHTPKENVLRSVRAVFSCPTPLLSVSSPFYLDSKLWTTSGFFVAVTQYSSLQVCKKPWLIFAFF